MLAAYLVIFERCLRQPPVTPIDDLVLSAFPSESFLASKYQLATVSTQSTTSKIVRVVFISDTRGKHRHMKLPPGEILVHSGSFTDFETGPDLLVQLFDFVSWITDVCASKYKRIILVPGQRDWLLDPALDASAYLSGSRVHDPKIARLIMDTELPANCTYLDGYKKLVVFVPTRAGGPCIRIGANSLSPFSKKKRRNQPKLSAFRWQHVLKEAGCTVTHDRYKTRRKGAVWNSLKTQLRSRASENATRNKQYVDPGEKLIIKFKDTTGEYAWVKSVDKPISGFIKIKNVHTSEFDPFAHWKKVLLINHPDENMKIDILVSHCPPGGLLDSADLPGCRALCECFRKNPDARPRFVLLSGSEKGHSIFRDICCVYPKWASGKTWFDNAMANPPGTTVNFTGIIFVSGTQTEFLPARLDYKSQMDAAACNSERWMALSPTECTCIHYCVVLFEKQKRVYVYCTHMSK